MTKHRKKNDWEKVKRKNLHTHTYTHTTTPHHNTLIYPSKQIKENNRQIHKFI